MITKAEIETHIATGPWRHLEAIAKQMVAHASENAASEFKPILGGGTRLMLSLRHRISDDIDLFIRDPQWIGYLTPRLNDSFEHLITGYDEGATSLKMKFAEGEIDFIVSMSLLGLPNETIDTACAFELEPLAEVLAKKLFYRGWALTPRDLFDWISIENTNLDFDQHATAIATLIDGRNQLIQSALQAMSQSAKAESIWSQIRTHALPDFSESIRWAQGRLSDFAEMAREAKASKNSAAMFLVPKN